MTGILLVVEILGIADFYNIKECPTADNKEKDESLKKMFPNLKCDYTYLDTDKKYGHCVNSGESVKCENIYNKNTCPTDRCDYDESAFRCKNKGEELPCSNYYNKNTCPTDRCEYDTDAYKCKKSGEELPCSNYYNKNTCPTNRCEYDENAYKCKKSGEELPCSNYYNEKTCPTKNNRCKIVELNENYKKCVDNNEEINCDQYIGKDNYCPTQLRNNNSIARCKIVNIPDKHATGDPKPTTNICVDNKSRDKCSDYTNFEYCNSNDKCIYVYKSYGSSCVDLNVNDCNQLHNDGEKCKTAGCNYSDKYKSCITPDEKNKLSNALNDTSDKGTTKNYINIFMRTKFQFTITLR